MARLYWMKLKRDFFKRHDIQVIEAMPNGKDYVLFYLKLLCESLDHEGNLRFSDTIPYNEEMLSAITHTNVDIVRSAMKILVNLGLVELLDDQTIYMSEVQKFIGSESDSAERMRRHRALKAGETSLSDSYVTESDESVTQSIDFRVKSLDNRDKIDEVCMYESKEKNNSLEVNAHAHARYSYEEIMDNMVLEVEVRPICWEFIKHCQLNKHTLTNQKLEDILVYLDLHGYGAEGKIQAFRDAINGGYYDIKREF